MKEKYITFKSLLAHIWRKITIAWGIDDSKYTMIQVAVNGRPRLIQQFQVNFSVIWPSMHFAKARVKQLIEGGLAEAARLIHEAAVTIDSRFVRSFIDFRAMYEDEDLILIYELHGISAHLFQPSFLFWLAYQRTLIPTQHSILACTLI